MQATIQNRLRLSEEADNVLQRYGKLYARVAAGGGRAWRTRPSSAAPTPFLHVCSMPWPATYRDCRTERGNCSRTDVRT